MSKNVQSVTTPLEDAMLLLPPHVRYEEEKDFDENGDDIVTERVGYDDKENVVIQEYMDETGLIPEKTVITVFNDRNAFEEQYTFNQHGEMTSAKFSREKLFRGRWDEVISVRIYSLRHVQRLSMALNQKMGGIGKDWDTFNFGFPSAQDMLEHNEENFEDQVDQRILIGFMHKPANDYESMRHSIGVMKLKFLGGKK